MTTQNNSPIGVFDSGLGGLTVAREIMRNLPKEKIVYFGDTARVPYGSKSKKNRGEICETERPFPEDAGDQSDRGRL